MAEQNVNFEDNNFMSFLNNEDAAMPSNDMNLEQELMMVDQFITEDQNQPSKREANVENEEGHVESPTTGENFTFKCVFCEQVLSFTDDVKLLECLHNSCSNCINNKLYEQSVGAGEKSTSIECTVCNLNSHHDKIIDNQFLLESNAEDAAASNKTAETKCSSCTEDVLATSWCVDCAEYICDSCVQAHQRLKITKDHTIKPKDEGPECRGAGERGAASLFCTTHPHERLSLFCENCDKLTCRDCQLTDHREHKYKFTNEIATEARKFICDMLKDVGYKRVLLTSAMKVIDDRQTLITEKKQALVKEITQLVVKLTNTINVRGKQLVAKLTEVCESKQKTLTEKKLALEQLSRMTDYCISFTQHALDRGSDMALLYSKKQVADHLKRIKCKRADIPNPEIPVRIHLALDKVPELVKVMSTIGQIVVDGRIYPSPSPGCSSEATSPAAGPPIGSPSPGHPPQQQSPISGPVAMLSVRPPPQYRPPVQFHGQSNGQITMQPRMQNMGPPTSMNQALIQQLNPNVRMPLVQQQQRIQRPLMPRNMIPMGQHHQQVSSSTHPQQQQQHQQQQMQMQQQLQDQRATSALRGLLQPNGPVYVQTGPSQYQAVQPGHLQLHGRFQQQGQHFQRPVANGNGMMVLHGQQQRAHAQRAAGQPLRWHIPQQAGSGGAHGAQQGNARSPNMPPINDNFKITLKQQNTGGEAKTPPSATVTSTIPKTPSPNLQGKSDTERNLDKCCEDSVKDLMATIAKLDSNGVQVLAESGRGGMASQKSSSGQQGGSPVHVDSTSTALQSVAQIKPEIVETVAPSAQGQKDDPNEDWCAVCMDGGELVCCDRCPKVFHQYCHIPSLSVEETGDIWQCLLCLNFSEVPENFGGEKRDGELTLKERKIAERLVLELYCQYDSSLPFREVIGAENIDYHAIIKNPIALDTIRQKLKWDTDERYRSLEDLVRDVRQMFKNAYSYNSVDSLVYNDAKTLEKFFDEQLEKFLPEFAYETFEEVQQPPRKIQRLVSD